MNDFLKKIQTSKFILGILAITLLLLFFPLIISIYTDFIVDPLLSKFHPTIFTDIVIIFCSLGLIAISILKIHKSYNGLLNCYISLFLLFIIVIYCIVHNNYVFYSFSFFNKLYITDYIISCIAFTLFYSITFFCIKRKNGHKIEEKEIKDELGRKDYANSIADYILRKRNNSNSYAIGITGCWGEGKTFFMELIKKRLKENKDCIIINFNPWYSSSPKALIQDFFTTLQNEIQLYNPNIGNSVKTYSRLLTKFYDNNNSLETLLDVFSNSSSSMKEEFEQIRNAIKKINKKIIICIDDLDRLDKEEVVETIRLIRNTANFDNTIFIVTYDKKYVVSALKGINEYATDTYLEKIFQHEITLPAYEESYLMNQLLELLSDRIDDSVKNWFETLTSEFYYKLSFLFFFKNLRSVNQFANSFCLPFALLKADICEKDFFFIYLLWYKFPEVYRLIKNDFFHLNFFSSSYFEQTKLRGQHNIIALKPHNNKEKKSEHEYVIMDYLASKYSAEEMKMIISLLKILFPFSNINHVSNNEPDNYKRIYYPYNFRKYFAFRISDKNISNDELNNTFLKNELAIKDRIEQWVRDEKHEVLFSFFEEKLNNLDKKEEYEKIMRSIIVLANQLHPQKREKEVSFNYFLFRENIISEKILNFYKTKIEHKKFILSLFNESFHPALFSTYFLKNQIEEAAVYKSLGKFPLKEEEIVEINLQHLKTYLEHSDKLTVQAFWLYHSCDNSKKEKNKTAGNLLINFAKKKDLKNFLKFMVTHVHGGNNLFHLSELIPNLFGEEHESTFESFLEDVSEDSDYYKEFMDFYKKFKGKRFTNVEFDFEHLDVIR